MNVKSAKKNALMSQWHQAMLVLNDNVLFDLLRNYLGTIKTPFHKPELVKRLGQFLGQEETQNRIIQGITSEQAIILSAIYYLNGATYQKLKSFLEGLVEKQALFHTILKLSDCMLIYQIQESTEFHITPILQKKLEEDVLSLELLFHFVQPSTAKEESRDFFSIPWLNDFFLAALLPTIFHRNLEIKQDGTINRRNLRDLEALFPLLLESESRFDTLMNSLRNLSLISIRNGEINLNIEQCDELFSLPPKERHFLLWGAFVFSNCNPQLDLLSNTSLGTSQTIAHMSQYVFDLLEHLPQDAALDMDGIRRWNFFSSSKAITSKQEEYQDVENFHRSISALVDLNLLKKNDELSPPVYRINEIALQWKQNPTLEAPEIIAQADFSVMFEPWADFSKVKTILWALELKSYSSHPIWQITKDSTQKALSQSTINCEALRKSLIELSKNRIPGNVLTSIDQWNLQIPKISIYHGYTLILEEATCQKVLSYYSTIKEKDRQDEVIHPQEDLLIISSRLWPTIKNYFEDLSITLPKVQLDLIEKNPTVPLRMRPLRSVSRPKILNDTLKLSRNSADDNDSKKQMLEQNNQSAKALIKQLLTQLESEADKNRWNNDIVKEFKLRIEQGMILFPQQLDPNILRREQTEARGLDYNAKLRLIQQTIKDREGILEIVISDSSESSTIIVQPNSIQDRGPAAQLLAKTLPEQKEIILPIKKMKLVRKLRGQLFFSIKR